MQKLLPRINDYNSYFFSRIKAGALVYTIIISLLIAILTGSILVYAYMIKLSLLADEGLNRRTNNLDSGLEMLMSVNNVIPENEIIYADLFGEGIDSVALSKKNWGCFKLITSESIWKNSVISKSALVGQYTKESDREAIYLVDNKKPLAICGNTRIKGKCLLPKLGVKRAYIEGKSFTGIKLIDGDINESSNNMPELNSEILESLSANLSGRFRETDSIIYYESIKDEPEITNSFKNKTWIIQSDQLIVLNNKIVNGNIIFYSSVGIELGSQVQFSSSILVGKYVEINDNFIGSLQSFATDSIIVGKGCRLFYPSALGVIGDGKALCSLTLQENAIVYGDIFLKCPNLSSNTSGIQTGNNSIVYGRVYSNTTMDLKGTIYGETISQKFTLATPSSTYENHLLDAVLDVTGLSSYFVNSCIGSSYSNQMKIVTWLQ